MATPNEEDVPELTTFQSQEAYVYAPLPPAPHYGHRAELWDVNKWLREVKSRVVMRHDDCFVRLEDLETGELFAECPLPNDGTSLTTAVEPVVDSSRYFVVKVVDRGDKKKHAFVGLGFRERSDASDFAAALDDYRQQLRRGREAEAMRQRFEGLAAAASSGGGGGEGEDGAAAGPRSGAAGPGATSIEDLRLRDTITIKLANLKRPESVSDGPKPLGRLSGPAAEAPRLLPTLSGIKLPPPPPAPVSRMVPSGPAGVQFGAATTLAAAAPAAVYDRPSRTYDGNVGNEYDAWTDEGILEHYWGEHIHLGWYTDEELARGWWTADFKAAKLRFTQEMFRFSGASAPRRVLDVGCGFGGSSRWLAAQFPGAEVVGITLSHKQVERATQLAKERGLTNVTFKVMDALAMEFEEGSFDLVWACESGEHMPDKQKYVEEMTRVLAPGGHMVIACWCQREETPERPLSAEDKARLQFLYEEWAHPYFISMQEFCRLMQGTGKLESVEAEDWTPQTLPSWRHSNLVGVLDPWFVVFKWNPKLWYKVTREIVTLERMHRAFAAGLMEYGLMRGIKAGALAAAGTGAAGAAAGAEGAAAGVAAGGRQLQGAAA